MLKDHGFSFVRHTRHGCLWSDGHSTLLLNRSRNYQQANAARNFVADLKRAVRNRGKR